ncbi:glucose-1-phosphate adenylyltransferase [Bacillus sp. BRMEA1]|uniref:glucose-1-phosphate adenylyltransferase n=1 Tax=Neobacillus endophyticus TaxID=2738405 RepID=UPI0015644A47|nr:glucose-1-phosphate adenylyltransferase [Neobacillus endophyticus]NRD80133.1 glucose-1-phosphate adenylyltransferase [Neobacillus endophyticus]
MKKRKVVAMLLAGGKGTRLNLLTRNIVKPAMPFGGKYRIIDFALSNCKNSGIDTVGILTQYRPHTLHSYLADCRFGNDRFSGLTILPPFQRDESGIEWYEGTSHAVYQNIEYIEQFRPDYVLILSGDQVYKMDYNLMIEQHVETNADCTISVVEVPWKDASRFGLIKIDQLNCQIIDFEEKPIKPTTNLASMGIYIFKWPILKKYLIQEEQKEFTHRDFAKDIIPAMMEDSLDLFAYRFHEYWQDVGTVHSYWEANLDLLNKKKNIFLQNPDWPIYSMEKSGHPTFIDESAKVHHSLISDGCEIYGTIEKSIVFSGVKIGKGAIIKNSLILPHTAIEENVWIENAVVGNGSVIKNGVYIVSKDPNEQLMVVGNQAVIDPDVEDVASKNNVKSVITNK